MEIIILLILFILFLFCADRCNNRLGFRDGINFCTTIIKDRDPETFRYLIHHTNNEFHKSIFKKLPK